MDRRASAFIALIVLSTLVLALGTMSFARDPVADITKELICTCGCGKVTYDCYCDLAKEWKDNITQDVAAGKTKAEIIASYVETYGDAVLATPKKSGLELSIWALPVVAAIGGTAVIYTYAKKKSPIPDSEVDSRVLEPGRSRKKDKKSKKSKGSKSTEHYDNLLRKEYKKQKKKKR
jgi:cytochrome c-type biogenesis protein CcmH